MLDRLREKIKLLWEGWQKDILVGLAVGLVALGSFGLGRLTAPRPKPPVTLREVDLKRYFVQENAPAGSGAGATAAKTEPVGTFLASKNGQRYYPKNCAAANRIKPENRVWFASIVEAEKAGYTRAANCP